MPGVVLVLYPLIVRILYDVASSPTQRIKTTRPLQSEHLLSPFHLDAPPVEHNALTAVFFFAAL